ncbi:hypothetical protein BYT27DRAFT_6753475 [Phlegmacium glaucopus]|nr:hypothetical protein BYT27DRAFT_6753475 [Phlegmacium glaucopus]
MRGCITSGEQWDTCSLFTRKGTTTEDTSLLQTNTLLGHSLKAWRLSSVFFMIGLTTLPVLSRHFSRLSNYVLLCRADTSAALHWVWPCSYAERQVSRSLFFHYRFSLRHPIQVSPIRHLPVLPINRGRESTKRYLCRLASLNSLPVLVFDSHLELLARLYFCSTSSLTTVLNLLRRAFL